jgi:hypothetical protein
MTKAQIEALPHYDEDRFSKDHKENERDWSDYNQRYRKSLETDGGVLHREASTHTITPEPSELPATGRALPDEDAYQPDRVAGVFTDTAPNANKTRMRPSGLAARAEDSAAPGTFVAGDKPTGLEEEEDWGRGAKRPAPITASGAASFKAPPLSSTPVQGQRDHLTDPEQVYLSEEARHSRLKAFEDQLRRNRVDITASCRSCGTRADKVA